MLTRVLDPAAVRDQERLGWRWMAPIIDRLGQPINQPDLLVDAA